MKNTQRWWKLTATIVRKLDHLTGNKIVITTSRYKTNKLVELKFVFSPELYYIPDHQMPDASEMV